MRAVGETTDKRDGMQRIRIGLTGLAGVLVLVLFAAAMLGLRSADTRRPAPNGRTVDETARAVDAPKDPLAELGVIPGGTADPAPATPAPAQPVPAVPAPVQPAPAGSVPPAPATPQTGPAAAP